MRSPPIPRRIPPLQWRAPAFLWTPLALGLAIGWPALLLGAEPALQHFALTAGAIVFALALAGLGVSWAMGRIPRTRRAVVLHVLAATALAALATPFALPELLAVATGREGAASVSMSMAMAPLALIVGLPIALISGLLFALVALKRPAPPPTALDDGGPRPHDVQPFR